MEIVEYSKTETALATLRERYRGVVYDVSKREGMTAANIVGKVAKKTAVVVFIAVCVFVAGINPFTY